MIIPHIYSPCENEQLLIQGGVNLSDCYYSLYVLVCIELKNSQKEKARVIQTIFESLNCATSLNKNHHKQIY